MSDKGLEATHVAKSFGGVQALKSAAVKVMPGQIVGLIGRNGSGKTTLFNCMTGFIGPDSGTVTVDGRDITGLEPHLIVSYGVSRTFQTPRLDASMTVKEAVCCGCFGKGKASMLETILGFPWALADERALGEQADAVLEDMNLQKFRDTEISRLSMGLVRMVDVARAILAGARYILLDEPAAGLTPEEQHVLADQVRRIAADGVGVLLVEHNFPLVRSLCDELTVLEYGAVLATGSPERIAHDPKVIASYLGDSAQTTVQTSPEVTAC